jgi:hypothetical protein
MRQPMDNPAACVKNALLSDHNTEQSQILKMILFNGDDFHSYEEYIQTVRYNGH